MPKFSRFPMVLWGSMALAVVTGCVSPEQAALNVRNGRLGQELAANPDPTVSAPGAEIAENSMALGESAFRGVVPAQIPTTPEQSATLRTQVVESAALWDRIKQGAAGLLGGIPWLTPVLTALGGAGGLLVRLAGKWKGLARSVITGVESYEAGDHLPGDSLKAHLGKQAEIDGVVKAAKAAVETFTGKPAGV